MIFKTSCMGDCVKLVGYKKYLAIIKDKFTNVELIVHNPLPFSQPTPRPSFARLYPAKFQCLFCLCSIFKAIKLSVSVNRPEKAETEH